MATKLVREQREFMTDSDDTNSSIECEQDIDINMDINLKPKSFTPNPSEIIVISDDDTDTDLFCQTPTASPVKKSSNGHHLNGGHRITTNCNPKPSKKRKLAQISTSDTDQVENIHWI